MIIGVGNDQFMWMYGMGIKPEFPEPPEVSSPGMHSERSLYHPAEINFEVALWETWGGCFADLIRVFCAPFYFPSFLDDTRIVHPRGFSQIGDRIVPHT